MVDTVSNSLNEQLFPLLQKERFVLLSTIDYEQLAPSVSAVSWVFAPNKATIRVAVDNRSRIIQNIKQNNRVVLTVIGACSVYAISGEAELVVEKMEEVPLKLAMISINIHEVRDVMFYGSRISIEPEYEKTYDKQAAAKLDNQVMTAMKKA